LPVMPENDIGVVRAPKRDDIIDIEVYESDKHTRE
jgi:hypothetical protein